MEGAMNFRDLGGIQLKGNSLTRNGVLFRSDGLSRLTVRDLKKFESLSNVWKMLGPSRVLDH